MTVIDWILICLVIIGFLPLVIIVYKKRLVTKILNTGVCTEAYIYSIHTAHKSATDIVHYTYHDHQSGKQHTGILTTKVGEHTIGGTIEIYYLPTNPGRSTVKGAWKSPAFIIFGIIIASFVIFAAWKIHIEVQGCRL
jgi:hypothetical protein